MHPARKSGLPRLAASRLGPRQRYAISTSGPPFPVLCIQGRQMGRGGHRHMTATNDIALQGMGSERRQAGGQGRRWKMCTQTKACGRVPPAHPL